MTTRYPDSLWFHTATSLDQNPPLEGDTDCDVVVIGAGFTRRTAAS